MNKPAFGSILEHSPSKPVLIFVSSRRQTRLTALDLISYCAAEDDPRMFLHLDDAEMAVAADSIVDGALRDTLSFGIGIHHAGLETSDRETVERLFTQGFIQVLVCTSTLAWGVNFPAHMVIVKGTEFFDAKTKRYVDYPVTDILQMMGRAGRPQFDTSAVACIFAHEPKKNYLKKFLHEPFPVESSLHLQLQNHFNAEISSASVLSLDDCIEYLSWTYFFRRLIMNPSYYNLNDNTEQGIKEYLVEICSRILKDLAASKCITLTEQLEVAPTYLGIIASVYYIDYKTVGGFDDFVMSAAGGSDLKSVLLTISNAVEFSELPVRHNEDGLNATLSAALPWTKEVRDFESPHIKTFLLLQAHFFAVTLPISDYVNDTKSVLDQIPRVVSALLDIAIEHKRAELIENIFILSQMIIQVLMLQYYVLRISMCFDE
jgi:activating signal cointegrator complex subunit 3